jgi:hypothetical protein
LTWFDAYAEEEDGDGEADACCCYGVEKLAELPEVECFGYVLRKNIFEVASCSIVDSE